MRLLCALAIGLSVGVSAKTVNAQGDLAPFAPFVETLHRDHPLVGKIWSAKTHSLVEAEAFAMDLKRVSAIFAGEVHDNADAHTVQAWILNKGLQGREVSGVVMEQVRADKQSTLDQFDALAANAKTAEAFFTITEWTKSGWPSPRIYRPLIKAVASSGAAVLAGKPTRASNMQVSRSGLSSLDYYDRYTLSLLKPLPPKQQAAMREEIAASHCGLLPKTALPRFVDVQRYWDAYLADAANRITSDLRSLGKDVLVVIAGNGHVRKDRAAPLYLKRRRRDISQVSVMVMEVEPGKVDPAGYVPRDPEGKAAADFVVFVPAHDRGDQCANLKKRFGKKT